MAAKKKAASAGAAMWALRESPAVRRLIEDAELRANIQQAYASTRNAYARLSNGKAPTKQIFDDKKLQRDLSKAANSLRDAGSALREGPRRKRRFGLGRLILLTLIGGGVALGVSENLRKQVLDALFGAEEEFEYTSTTTAPAPDAAATAGTAGTTGTTGTTTIIAPASEGGTATGTPGTTGGTVE